MKLAPFLTAVAGVALSANVVLAGSSGFGSRAYENFDEAQAFILWIVLTGDGGRIAITALPFNDLETPEENEYACYRQIADTVIDFGRRGYAVEAFCAPKRGLD